RVVEQVKETASNIGESVSGMMPGRSSGSSMPRRPAGSSMPSRPSPSSMPPSRPPAPPAPPARGEDDMMTGGVGGHTGGDDNDEF
ncbi:MAG: hypothetical protein ACXVJT_10485, partial [Thermoanaerobaculia bacterium]